MTQETPRDDQEMKECLVAWGASLRAQELLTTQLNQLDPATREFSLTLDKLSASYLSNLTSQSVTPEVIPSPLNLDDILAENKAMNETLNSLPRLDKELALIDYYLSN